MKLANRLARNIEKATLLILCYKRSGLESALFSPEICEGWISQSVFCASSDSPNSRHPVVWVARYLPIGLGPICAHKWGIKREDPHLVNEQFKIWGP